MKDWPISAMARLPGGAARSVVASIAGRVAVAAL
jgi:hypothetical protein